MIQLKLSLSDSRPLIWRRIRVSEDTSFFELHHIFQVSMGWANYHLFEFLMEGYRIGEVDEEEKTLGYGSDRVLAAKDLLLKDMISRAKESFRYLYDFGDGWQHDVEVEDIILGSAGKGLPICLDGQMSCPPEDCGGLRSFYYCLDVLKDKKHSEYKDIRRQFGKNYDPEKFDKAKVNSQLSGLDKYIKKWLNG